MRTREQGPTELWSLQEEGKGQSVKRGTVEQVWIVLPSPALRGAGQLPCSLVVRPPSSKVARREPDTITPIPTSSPTHNTTQCP